MLRHLAMDEKLKEFEKSIKKKHSIAFTPKYWEAFYIETKARTFVEIAAKVMEDLDWQIIHRDDKQIKAIRAKGFGNQGEEISAEMVYDGKAEVKSESLGGEIWDVGRNSKRVKLFIYAFKEQFKNYDKEQIISLEEEIKKTDNWDDYIIPEKLPQPPHYSKPQILIPIFGSFISAIILAFVLAFVSVKGMYLIGLFEFLIGLAIGFTLKYFIKWGNFTNFQLLKYVIGGTVLSTYILNQYFQYHIILMENDYSPIGFIEFLKIRFQQGLTIKSLNTGSIGLVISWILQLVISFYVAQFKVLSSLIKFLIERVPKEVIDFTLYHFVKEKSEKEVLQELYKMGWKSELEQKMVMEAVEGIHGNQTLAKA